MTFSDATTAPNLPQAVRAHFGLDFGPLAGWLGVSEATLWQAAAANRRELPTAALLRLAPLATALPPPWNPTNPAEPEAAEPPLPAALLPALATPLDAAALRERLAACRHLLLRGTRALAPLLRRQAQARRLQAVLPALAAAYPPATDVAAARWLPLFAALVAERLGPAAGATLALALARQQGLRLEAAQLAAWLGE